MFWMNFAHNLIFHSRSENNNTNRKNYYMAGSIMATLPDWTWFRYYSFNQKGNTT